MRVFFVSKRHPQQRDLVERPYGRFHHLPVALAAAGHDVRVALVSHRGLASIERDADGLLWSSRDIRTLGPVRLLRDLAQQARAYRPDWVVGMSDAQYGWLAHRLSRHADARLAIDAYDNYESYMPWNLPLHWLWRRALAAADLVTVAGPQLARKVARSRSDSASVHILPMTADPAFVTIDRTSCRQTLGLPLDIPLFGYAGGWTRSRGSNLVLEAFRIVRNRLPNAGLVLTGKPPASALHETGVINLGYLNDAQMPMVLNAVDLCCVVLANTAFGRYSYPAKLCEAMACGVPVVASATESVTWMLGNDQRFLARVGDAEDHARAMLANYTMRDVAYMMPPPWRVSAGRLSELLSNFS